MSATPKFAHAVFQTAQPTQMTDWYCTVLDGHVVYQDNALCFITFDSEHHRVALIHPPVPRKRKSPPPPRCTTSMYYQDPDGNMVEMQTDRFAEPAGYVRHQGRSCHDRRYQHRTPAFS